MIVARLIISLINLLIGVLVALCGISYQIASVAPNKIGVHAVELLGRNVRLPDPLGVISYTAEEGVMGYEGISDQTLFWMAMGAVIWLVLFIVWGKIFRLFANKKTTLHGSSKWATEKELAEAGLLHGTGLVLGQTYDATYKETKKKPPKRKKGESRAEFAERKARFDPLEKNMSFVKPGRLITQEKNAHTLIVGSTRSGKGVSVIIPTEFLWQESMIIFDPKAEGWDIAGNFRSRFSFCFKFEPEKPNESIHYNPLLSIRRGRQTIPDIQNLSYILIPNNENEKDPFWNNEARKLFAAVVGYVIYCEPPERKTFAQVYSIFSNTEALQDEDESDEDEGLSMVKRYLNSYAKKADKYIQERALPIDLDNKLRNKDKLSSKEREILEKQAKGYLDEDDRNSLRRIQQDLIYFANCEDKQLSSVVSTMTSQLQVIADPNVQAITDRSDFIMDDFVRGVKAEDGKLHPLTLYLVASASSIQRLVPLFKIFYEQAITLLTRELEMKRPYRLLLMFDEFRQLGKMEIVEKALALTAGYGILCCIAVQTFAQLRVLYQDEAMFIDNFAYQVVLKVNDEQTCAKIERILGQATKQHWSESYSGNANMMTTTGRNRQVQEVGRSLMTAEEVRTMPDNELLIISSGMHPYKGKKVRYYLDERFRRLYLDKKGHKLPVPKMEDNYPHPETIDKDGVNHGIDGEGWHELLGFEAALGGSEELIDAEKLASASEAIPDGKDDYIKDSIETAKPATEKESHKETALQDELNEGMEVPDLISKLTDELGKLGTRDERMDFLGNVLESLTYEQGSVIKAALGLDKEERS